MEQSATATNQTGASSMPIRRTVVPMARGIAVDASTEEAKNQHGDAIPSKDTFPASILDEDLKSHSSQDASGEQHSSEQELKLEANVQNGEEKHVNNSQHLQSTVQYPDDKHHPYALPRHDRKSSSEVERVFQHMKADEIAYLDYEGKPVTRKSIESDHDHNAPDGDKVQIGADGVRRRTEDDKQVEHEEPLQVKVEHLITYQPLPENRDPPPQMDKVEADKVNPFKDQEIYPVVSEIVNEIAEERLGTPAPSLNPETRENSLAPETATVVSAAKSESWASRIAESKKHQAPSWFKAMDKDGQIRLKNIVMTAIAGKLSYGLETELYLNFGLNKERVQQIENYMKYTEGKSSSSSDELKKEAERRKKLEEESEWTRLGGARRRGRNRRRVRRKTPSGRSVSASVSYTESERGLSNPPAETFTRDPSAAPSAANSMTSLPAVPTGNKKLSLKEIKAQQLRVSTNTSKMEKIVQDLNAENLQESAKNFVGLLCGSDGAAYDDLYIKAIHLILRAKGHVVHGKDANGRDMPVPKMKPEERGPLLGLFAVGVVEAITEKSRSDLVGENFCNMILERCLDECRSNRRPSGQVMFILGELFKHGYCEDEFMHLCVKALLQPGKRSHIQAVTTMLTHCASEWKVKLRIMFPFYDELKRQARGMGKPTYLAVKQLAQRERPSWMDRLEDAKEKREKRHGQAKREEPIQGFREAAARRRGQNMPNRPLIPVPRRKRNKGRSNRNASPARSDDGSQGGRRRNRKGKRGNRGSGVQLSNPEETSNRGGRRGKKKNRGKNNQNVEQQQQAQGKSKRRKKNKKGNRQSPAPSVDGSLGSPRTYSNLIKALPSADLEPEMKQPHVVFMPHMAPMAMMPQMAPVAMPQPVPMAMAQMPPMVAMPEMAPAPAMPEMPPMPAMPEHAMAPMPMIPTVSSPAPKPDLSLMSMIPTVSSPVVARNVSPTVGQSFNAQAYTFPSDGPLMADDDDLAPPGARNAEPPFFAIENLVPPARFSDKVSDAPSALSNDHTSSCGSVIDTTIRPTDKLVLEDFSDEKDPMPPAASAKPGRKNRRKKKRSGRKKKSSKKKTHRGRA